MADLGFLPVVTRLLDQTPSGGQRMFFSATLDRGVGQLVTRYVTDPALHAVPVTTESTPAEHSVLVLRAEDKVPVAAEIASRPGGRCSSSGPSTARTGWCCSCPGPASAPGPSTATATRTSASVRSKRSQPGIPGCSWPPTSRPAASTSMTSTSSSVRPAGGRQGLPAPLRSHGAGRRLGPGRRARRARAVRDLQRTHTAAGIDRPRHDAVRGHARSASWRPRAPRSRPPRHRFATYQRATDQRARTSRHGPVRQQQDVNGTVNTSRNSVPRNGTPRPAPTAQPAGQDRLTQQRHSGRVRPSLGKAVCRLGPTAAAYGRRVWGRVKHAFVLGDRFDLRRPAPLND